MTDNMNTALVADVSIKVNGSKLSAEQMGLLQHVEVDLGIDGPGMATIILTEKGGSQGAALELIDGETFGLGKPLEIGFGSSLEDSIKSVFKGEIVAIEPVFERGALASLVVRGYDKSHRLYRETKTRSHVNVKDSDLAQRIASSAGLSPQIDSTTVVHKHIYQDGISDMEFLKQRASRIGYEFWVDDEKLYFKKPDTAVGGEVALTWGETLDAFYPSMSAAHQVDQVEVKGWDPIKKEAVVGQAASSNTHPAIGFGKSGGAAAKSAIAAAKKLEVRLPVSTKAEADLMAQAILNSTNGEFIVADGEADGNASIKVGGYVKIDKIGRKFSGKYKVTSVRHVYSSGDFKTLFTVRSMSANILSTISGTKPDEPVSRWMGVMPAIVTNNGNPTQEYNDYGVVKVKFPWLADTEESFWARVALPGAGHERGVFFIPEVNDEVLVAFEQGDFNRPYILGGLYNGKDKPVEPNNVAVANGNVETRTIKTRTGQMIRFRESQGENSIEIIDGSKKTRILMDSKNQKIEVFCEGDVTVTSKTGSISMEAQKDINLTALTGKINIDSQKSDLSLHGLKIEAAAETNAEYKANGSMTVKSNGSTTVEGMGPTTLKSAAVTTVQGSVVKIN